MPESRPALPEPFSTEQEKPVMGILGEYDALSSLSQKAADPHKEPLKEALRDMAAATRALGTALSPLPWLSGNT